MNPVKNKRMISLSLMDIYQLMNNWIKIIKMNKIIIVKGIKKNKGEKALTFLCSKIIRKAKM